MKEQGLQEGASCPRVNEVMTNFNFIWARALEDRGFRYYSSFK